MDVSWGRRLASLGLKVHSFDRGAALEGLLAEEFDGNPPGLDSQV